MEKNTLKPKYLQIKDYFVKKIENHEYGNNEKLPSEREISEKFGVSRMTARNAILELVKEGFAFRKGANGTFVSQTKMKRTFFPMGGLSMHLKEGGIPNPVSKVITFEKSEANAHVSKLLNVSIGTEYYHLVRLRIGDDEPLAIDESYINGLFFSNLEEYNFEEISLWDTLLSSAEHRPARGVNNLELYYFNNQESKLLNIKKDEVGFKVSNINYDRYGNIIENSTTLYRGDLFVFSYEVDID